MKRLNHPLFPLLLTSLLTCVACGDDDAPEPSTQTGTTVGTTVGTSSTTGSTGTTGTTTGTTGTPAVEPRPTDSDPWCAHIAAGPASGGEKLLGLSQAHARVRFFGAFETYSEVDETLSKTLEASDALEHPNTLFEYAAALSGVCALDGEPVLDMLPTSTQTLDGKTLLLTPGSAPQTIPAEVEVVVLDLRDIPYHQDTAQSLLETLSLALDTPFDLPDRTVRQHNGMIDEYFTVQIGSTNVFTALLSKRSGATVPAAATQERTLIVWTAERSHPAAAELAAALRIQGRAWVVGADIHSAVAEASWVGVARHGIAWRSRDLKYEDTRLPDIVEADETTPTTLQEITAWAQSVAQTPDAISSASWTAERPALTTPRPNSDEDTHAPDISRGQTRSALITAHGAARLFFPFFDIVAQDFDPRLFEVLAETQDPITQRKESHRLIRRLSNALEDAHSFIPDLASDETSRYQDVIGFLPVALDPIQDKILVRKSAEPAISPGDELLSIDGVPVQDLISAERALVSAATPTNGTLQALTPLVYLTKTTPVTLRAPDGTERTLSIEPAPYSVYSSLQGINPTRPSGWLDELGASDILYFNLDGRQISTDEALQELFPSIASARAIILDMRGYPGTWTALYQLAGIIVGEPYSSPYFTTPVWTGPEDFQISETKSAYTGPPNRYDAFDGPVILMVGPGSQSAAENFSMGLVSERAVTTIGRQSSGTNGNITGLILPGQFAFTFTGIGVETSTRRRFHGVGIQPTIEIYPTPEELASDPDPELSEALRTIETL